MRIGVDGRGLRGGRGIARVTAGLLDALAEARPQEDVVVVAPRRARRATFAAAALTGRPRLDRMAGGCDVVWLPAPAPVAVSPGVPFVLTVHDLSFAERPGDFTTYERLWHAAARPARLIGRAAVVTCVSQATRDAVVARGWADPARVRVVRPGVALPAEPPAPDPRLPDRFLLAVGAQEPRKGTDVLLDAFGRARAAGLTSALLLVGDGRLAPDPAPPGVHHLGRVDEARLAAAYAQARALVLPSRLEGLGLTPLEAAAHGTPSVVSDLPALRETLGDEGALRVAPGDAAALADALVRIERDDALHARLATTARAALAPLTWDAAAAGLHAALAEAAR